MSLNTIFKGVTEGIEDLVAFAAIFVFGMIFIGEIYGVYTVHTLSQGIVSPFWYPVWVAAFLLVVRILDDLFEGKK